MSERRQTKRWRARHWSARVRPGYPVHIVNVSAGGALLEAAQPLRPGADLEVQFEHAGGRVRMTGTVVRCRVSAIDPHRGPTYRAAVSFNETFEWARERTTRAGYGVPKFRLWGSKTENGTLK
jgi:hypothetical protein